MSAATMVVRQSLELADFCVQSYLQDLNDADLLKRPTTGANHIAWQLGHLIKAEHDLIDMVCPNAMPDLPEGFGDKYTNDTAGSDDAAAFDSKQQYLTLMREQRAGTLAALEKLSDSDLQQAAPEPIRQYVPTVGAAFAMQATHWMMHSGQWVIVRRMLGKKANF